jgi:cellulose synthase/poly-beta-1,6-N-acetylglucosamine synthase-like glycosyltransferase
MLEMILAAVAWFTLIGYGVTTLEFLIGNRSIRNIKDIPIPQEDASDVYPTVSIIIPARNEERNIQEALTSVLHLDYPNYELIVLNDRSEDRTGDILNELATHFPQLKIVHIQSLPEGWLGKNHALYLGAQASSGDLLLFTDADIIMEPDTLKRAVLYLEGRDLKKRSTQAQPLDHLAIWPEIISPDLFLKIFMNTFTVFFCLYSRPWRAIDPKSKNFIGIGAFNLIRKSVYEAIDTHRAIALRPDDDMKLGKLVKKHGFRQAVGNGMGLIRVEWYTSLKELVQGLMKNAFAGLDYNLPYMLYGISAQFLFSVWPVIALFVTQGQTFQLNVISLLLMQILCFDNARYNRQLPWAGLFFPVGAILMIYIIVKATALTLWRHGIEWRGTHYELSALKANRIEFD